MIVHVRAKHSDSCWRCDEPWPCEAMAERIDADHEWALWHEKWCAAIDRAEKLRPFAVEVAGRQCTCELWDGPGRCFSCRANAALREEGE